MDAKTARANPQKFIDYLSTSDKVLWHFINDPYWGYNVKTPPNWGWCGSVQANFFGSLMHDFKSYKHGEFRKLTLLITFVWMITTTILLFDVTFTNSIIGTINFVIWLLTNAYFLGNVIYRSI